MHNRYLKQAKKRGHIFNLSREEFTNLVLSNKCFYCGCTPFQESYGTLVLGIDRIDNNIGYYQFNCVPCCKDCNFLKGDLPLHRFLNKFNGKAVN